MEFKDDEIKRLQLASEAEEKKRFLHNAGAINQAIVDGVETNPISTPETTSDIDSSPYLKQIRTFQGDVATALKDQNESLVSIQKSQAIKNESVPKDPEAESKSANRKTLAFIGGIIVLILLGTGGGYFSYLRFKEKTAAPIIVAPLNKFIPVREEKNINVLDLNRQSFLALIQEESAKNTLQVGRGEVVQFQLRKGESETSPLLQISEFLVFLESRAPSALIRAFDSLFMVGFLGRDTQRPFLLIKLDSFEQAFPGMLEWEENLSVDLLPIFINDEKLSSITLNKEFEDLTITNKDARVLRNNLGESVLLYTFIDNEFLLITDGEESMKSLLGIISIGNLSR